MLTKTSIILFLMLITFPPDGEGFRGRNIGSTEIWSPRIPSRLQHSRNVTFRRAIFNGTPARIEDFPFKLSLRFYGELFCGATVIGSRWALSAAHCLEYMWDAEWITVYGGSSNRLTGGDEFHVESYELHPEYNAIILDFDVAVIKIKESFDGHPIIRRVILANERCMTCDGARVRLSGWGRNEEDIFPEELHQIQQSILDHDECFRQWGGDITSRMLCATVENGEDSCNGDSGGAVLKSCMQVGIISFGSSDCGSEMPSVFTRIEDPAIRRFIRTRTGI